MNDNRLSIENLSKRFGRFQALDAVSLSAHGGEVVAIMGPNGSGKSTLLKSLVGLVRPDRGVISFRGENVLNHSAWRHQLGYMPQIARYPDNLSVLELMHLVEDVRNSRGERDLSLIEDFELEKFSGKKLAALSGGMKQRVNAALAFWFRPELIVLDEPTASLDPLAAEQLKAKIRQQRAQGKLILLTSHIVSEVEEIADRVIYMLEGRICIDAAPGALCGETGSQRLNGAIAARIGAYASQQ